MDSDGPEELCLDGGPDLPGVLTLKLTFKITHNIYDTTVSPGLPFNERANTRGNHHKLQNHSFPYDLRKHFFSASIVNIWNSLPNSVVDACTVNAFKARLDKFWWHQFRAYSKEFFAQFQKFMYDVMH